MWASKNIYTDGSFRPLGQLESAVSRVDSSAVLDASPGCWRSASLLSLDFLNWSLTVRCCLKSYLELFFFWYGYLTQSAAYSKFSQCLPSMKVLVDYSECSDCDWYYCHLLEAKLILRWEMDSGTSVQIQDESVFISHHTDILRKGIKSNYSPSSCG